ncbi:MAG: [FeFe] hydrogenase H-cluster maturation GTPase HydF [Exilispira sp.]
MIKTPTSERIKIVIFGKRNSGKSSLINNIAQKDIAIISNIPGTTTDPVNYTMELAQLGPVVFIDTAGIDDVGDLGNLRVKKTIEKLNIADLCIFVTSAHENISEIEIKFFNEIKQKKPVFVVFTFYNGFIHPSKNFLKNENHVMVDNIKGYGAFELREKIISMKNLIETEPGLLEGLFDKNDFVILVTPIDTAAPKGRLILPQVEAIRELLDNDCGVLVLKENELEYFYDNIGIKPKIVITDSQAFGKVSTVIPPEQKLTSFSILMAKKKGDLIPFIESLKSFEKLKPNSNILILEACSHHKQKDDIGSVKIPEFVKKKVQKEVRFEWKKQITDPSQIEGFDGIIMCGGCMTSRNQYLNTQKMIKDLNIPMLNYGLFLAWAFGLLPRAIEIFPEIYEKYCSIMK